MNNFTVPTNGQSTRTAPASTDAGMTLSDLFADPTTPTGGTLQPLNQGPLIIDEFVTAAIPWIFVNYLMPLKATNQTTWESTDGDITVFLSATPYKDAHGVTQQHLPSGRIAREVLVYLVTSAMASGSPENRNFSHLARIPARYGNSVQPSESSRCPEAATCHPEHDDQHFAPRDDAGRN